MVDKQDSLPSSHKDYEALSKLNLFSELMAFIKESPAIAITLAYMILILSSMTYLYLLFSEFGINVIKFLTLEDILATPIKNPDIIVVFVLITVLFYLADMSARFGARLKLKYANQKNPLWLSILSPFFWVPKDRKTNIRWTIFTIISFLIIYIIMFAKFEADMIKEGDGTQIIINSGETDAAQVTTLLGTSNLYIFTYNKIEDTPVIYYVESINSILPVKDESEATQSNISD